MISFKALFTSSGSIHILNVSVFLTATKEDIQFVSSLTSFKIPCLII